MAAHSGVATYFHIYRTPHAIIIIATPRILANTYMPERAAEPCHAAGHAYVAMAMTLLSPRHAISLFIASHYSLILLSCRHTPQCVIRCQHATAADATIHAARSRRLSSICRWHTPRLPSRWLITPLSLRYCHCHIFTAIFIRHVATSLYGHHC